LIQFVASLGENVVLFYACAAHHMDLCVEEHDTAELRYLAASHSENGDVNSRQRISSSSFLLVLLFSTKTGHWLFGRQERHLFVSIAWAWYSIFVVLLTSTTYDAIRYDTRFCFNVRSKADISRLNLPHGDNN